MKTVYLFDIDLIERKRYPQFPKLPNHALMKMSAYFKKKGYKIVLVYLPKYIPKEYKSENKYIGSALYSGNLENFKKRINLLNAKHKTTLNLEHIKIGTPYNTCPITDLEGLKCDYTEYDKMIKKDGIKMAWYPSNVGFLTRGCKRHCNFCVNRDRNEITPVSNMEDIYVKKGRPIYLLDDNLFASEDAVKYFNEIADFGRKHPQIKLSLQNGIDCRVMPEDKLEALAKASKYLGALHVAWDNVKNTYIFKNICKLKKYVGSNIACYLLLGEEVYTDEEFKKDILAFFYRYFQLMKIGASPINQLYEDDREEYQNPYWDLYTVFLKQYSFMHRGRYVNIYRELPPNYRPYAKRIVKLLGEYSWIVEKPIGNILRNPNFDEQMKDIADYIGVKHYSIPKELYVQHINQK